MSADPTGQSSESQTSPGDSDGKRREEELRAAYEAELSRVTSAEMILNAAVSLLNIGSRRLGAGGSTPAGAAGAGGASAGAAASVERDLEQVRDAIDGVRALVGILERRLPRELGPLRDALSQLQMAYAREVQLSGGETGPAATETDERPDRADAGQPGQGPPSDKDSGLAGDEGAKGPGPAEASGRLWVPGR